MTFRLAYEIIHDQPSPGEAGRIVRLDLECEPASENEVLMAIDAFLRGVAAERDALKIGDETP